MKSYVAVQKKLLTTIYALWKNNTAFAEDHITVTSKQKNNHTSSVVTQGKHEDKMSLHVSFQLLQI